MRTPRLLWLLSVVIAPAWAQSPMAADVMRIDPVVQHQRDATRVEILRDEAACEGNELATAESTLRAAPTAAADATRHDLEQRIAQHRRNLAELQHEIDLANRPTHNAIVAKRDTSQAGNWLIVGQRGNAIGMTVDHTTRRALPATDIDVDALPAWIIPTRGHETQP